MARLTQGNVWNSVENVSQLEREMDGVDPSTASVSPPTADLLLNEFPIFKTSPH